MLKRMNDQLSQLENLAEGIDRDLRFNKAHFDQFLEENK